MTQTPEAIVKAILAGEVDALTVSALVDAIKDAEPGDAVLALSQLLAALLLAQAQVKAAQQPQVVPVPVPEGESPGSQYLLCSWRTAASLRQALRELERRGDVLEYVQPNRARQADLPVPVPG